MKRINTQFVNIKSENHLKNAKYIYINYFYKN